MVDATSLGIEALRRLNAAAPAPLASRAQRARLVGERKPVTAVFADIVASTSLAEQIDPEDWTLIINAAFDEMSRCIFDFEGTIAQLQGDAIISFFGAPVAHEDDPERAVRAALAMTASMERYREEIRASHGIEFRIRVGVCTGLVMVGNVGSDLRYDYTAIGDTMNLASRLEGAAQPGQILIADRTERFVRAHFELEDIGTLELKGKADAVRAFSVVGPRAEPGATRGIEGLDSVMVGRDRELAELMALAATVRAGRGRTAIVVAEPGLGKSRLLRELRTAIAEVEADGDTEMAWVVGQGSSYGARMPFHLITNLILGVVGLTPANRPQEVEAALRALIHDLLPDDTEAIDYLTFLMGLAPSDQPGTAQQTSGSFLSERLAATVLRLIRAVARQGPLVVLIEDLHWADPASAELLKAMLTVTDDEPVLLVCTTRDEPESAGWAVVDGARSRSGRGLTEIRLEPLDRADAQALVASLLEVESLASTTRDLILAKAEGNPFYVEEVIRMLIDERLIERRDGRWKATPAGRSADLAIPDTLHGLILARIDRLPAEARQVLRLASCIDRTFAIALLEDVAREAGMDAGIGSALTRLEGVNLLSLAESEPVLSYRFSHALIQDAAYQTVLRQERRTWHGFVAAALLARYPDRESEMADRLARHFELAGDTDRAVDNLLLAAEGAMARNAMVDAGGLFGHAESLLPAAASGDDAQPGVAATHDRRRLRITLGRLASGFEFMSSEEVLGEIERGRVLARRLDDDAVLADLTFWEVATRQAAGERPERSAALREAMEQMHRLGDVSGDPVQRAQALSRGGAYLWWSGDFRRSLDMLVGASTLFQKNGDVIGASMAESYMGADLASLGRFEEAEERMGESRRLAASADLLSQLDFHLAEAAVAGLRGDYATSIRFAGECFEGSAEIGALGCATVSGMVLGASQMATGAVRAARLSLERSLDYAAQAALAPIRLRGQSLLAALDGASGDMGKAEAGFHTALAGLASMGGEYGQAEARLARGMILATHPDGDGARALTDLDAAVEVFEALDARPDLARAHRARGLALARLGDVDGADESLARSADMASTMGLMDGPWLASVSELEGARVALSTIDLID